MRYQVNKLILAGYIPYPDIARRFSGLESHQVGYHARVCLGIRRVQAPAHVVRRSEQLPPGWEFAWGGTPDTGWSRLGLEARLARIRADIQAVQQGGNCDSEGSLPKY